MLTFENFMMSVIKADDTYVVEVDSLSGSKCIEVHVHKIVGGAIKSHHSVIDHDDNQYAAYGNMTFSQEKKFASWLKSFLSKRPGNKIVLIGSFRYTKMLPLSSIVGDFSATPWMRERDPWANIDIK